MAIGWHRGNTPGLHTEPCSGGLGDVPPWWGVRGELEGFFDFSKLGAWWFSAPSFWSSVVSAFGSPLAQRLCGFSFPPVWISVVAHSQFPLSSGIGVVHPWFPPVQSSEFVCFQFSPCLEVGGCPLSVLQEFEVRVLSALGCPWIWSLEVVCTAFWE